MDTKLQHLYEQIGRNVKAARMATGKSLSEIARIARINKGTLSKIESATTAPSVEMLMIIGEALGVDPFLLMMPEEDAEALRRLTRNINNARPPIETERELTRRK